jgi:S-adenosylmethionine:tRNA ribosyltransferase-isomerase
VRPAPWPRPSEEERLVLVDPTSDRVRLGVLADLFSELSSGDVVVVNDAATLPASLAARTAAGLPVELRLTGRLIGATALREGDLLSFGGEDAAQARVLEVSPVSPRLVTLAFVDASPLDVIYRHGVPVQYSYSARELPLWSVQTSYAARPWAVEMPSAGRPLSVSTLAALRRRGVRVGWVTHAAGLSTTGDESLDRRLPFPERYEIPPETVALVNEARRGLDARVLAVGTSVVRALEGAVAEHGRLVPAAGVTDLRIRPGFRPRVVTGLLSGLHEPGESHFELLGAFASGALLAEAHRVASRADLVHHEFGDKIFVAPSRNVRVHQEVALVEGDAGGATAAASSESSRSVRSSPLANTSPSRSLRVSRMSGVSR